MSCPAILFCLFFLLSVTSSQPTARKIFVVGDSISIQYGPYLEQYLMGSFEYDRKRDAGGTLPDLGVPEGENGGDSRMVLEFLKSKAREASFTPDVILLNSGLHDIKRDLERDEALQVGPESYRTNLEEIFSVVRQIGASLVWVRTTPVVEEIHNTRSQQFHRYSKDLETYNAIADEVFAGHDVPRIDLYNFTKCLGNDVVVDHVHYDERTRALQAAYIAGFLNLLGQK